MTKRPAPDDDDAPVQASRWDDELVARRIEKLGFLGLPCGDILREIITYIDPWALYGGSPFGGELYVMATDATTIRRWIDRWPAFDWSRLLREAMFYRRITLAHSILLDDRVDPTINDNAVAETAAAIGNSDIIARLLTHPRVNVAATRMLPWAVERGHVHIAKMLLADARIDPSSNKCYAVTEAMENAPDELILLMLSDARVNPAANDNWIICRAAMFGRINIVRALMADRRVNPAARNNRPLVDAIGAGHDDTAMLLLRDPRVSPAARSGNAIVLAATNGCVKVVSRLMADQRVDPTISDNAPLIGAASNGHLVIVRMLLAHPRVDPRAQDSQALTGAIKGGHCDVVECLWADPRVDPTYANNRAIHTAADAGSEPCHTAMVKLLLSDDRIDPSADGNGALRLAIMSNRTEIVALLLVDSRVTIGPDERLIGRMVREPLLSALLADRRINPRGFATYDEWEANGK